MEGTNKAVTDTEAINRFFRNPGGARPFITTEEWAALTIKDRDELAVGAATALGIQLIPREDQ
jgi:hypothetical protein